MKNVHKLHKDLGRELTRKEKVLREQLSREYELKLKEQIQKHRQEIKQKKIELEAEMQKKIKQMLG